MHRFYASSGLDDAAVVIDGPEAHHMLHVVRCRAGDRVELFDGRGTAAVAVLEAVRDKQATLRVIERRRCPRDATPPVTLATAVPKGDRFRWLVEKATELGVSRLVPLRTGRSVVVPSSSKLRKMRQTVIEACKQSGRNWLMDVAEPVDWDRWVGEVTGAETLLVADPKGRRIDVSLAEQLKRAGRPVCLAIGPEGGFTEEEIAVAREAGAVLVCLGPRTLRIETAAVALCAWLTLTTGTDSL